MTAYVGREVGIEFAIADENASLGSLTFKPLGMMRSKTFDTSWEVADTTADDSPSFTKTQLVTFKSVTFSGDGVSYTDTVHNQKEFARHAVTPGVVTANQPKVWLRLTFPDEILTGPFIITSMGKSAAYDQAVTWSFEAGSNGAVTSTDPV